MDSRLTALWLSGKKTGKTTEDSDALLSLVCFGAGELEAGVAVVMRFRRVRPGAIAPAYMTAGAAGMDLASAADGPVTMAPGQRVSVPTGLILEIPAGHEGQVRPRSGLARKHGVTLTNSPGTIDSDYRGEVAVLLVNLGQEPYTIAPGERIAQLVVAPVTQVVLQVVLEKGEEGEEGEEGENLSSTVRGSGGFGHTG